LQRKRPAPGFLEKLLEMYQSRDKSAREAWYISEPPFKYKKLLSITLAGIVIDNKVEFVN